MTAHEFDQFRQADDHVVIDIRLDNAYAAGHIPGALSAPYRRQAWARMVAEWIQRQADNTKVGLFGDNPVVVRAATDNLRDAGVAVDATFDQGLPAWQAAGYPVVAVQPLTADQLAAELEAWTVIDVREPYEFRSGIIPGAQLVPLGGLEEATGTLDKERRYAIVCASGNRSQSAAAYLAEQGFDVANVVGGMSLWLAGGHPVQRV